MITVSFSMILSRPVLLWEGFAFNINHLAEHLVDICLSWWSPLCCICVNNVDVTHGGNLWRVRVEKGHFAGGKKWTNDEVTNDQWSMYICSSLLHWDSRDLPAESRANSISEFISTELEGKCGRIDRWMGGIKAWMNREMDEALKAMLRWLEDNMG